MAAPAGRAGAGTRSLGSRSPAASAPPRPPPSERQSRRPSVRPPDPRGRDPACGPHPGAAAADRGAFAVLPAAAAAVAGQDVLQVHLHPAARRGGGKAAGGPRHATPGIWAGPSRRRAALRRSEERGNGGRPREGAAGGLARDRAAGDTERPGLSAAARRRCELLSGGRSAAGAFLCRESRRRRIRGTSPELFVAACEPQLAGRGAFV